MADRPRYPGSGEDIGAEPDRKSTTHSRWPKALIVVFGLLFLAIILLHLLTGGGPASH
jgi:hypothetical protein